MLERTIIALLSANLISDFFTGEQILNPLNPKDNIIRNRQYKRLERDAARMQKKRQKESTPNYSRSAESNKLFSDWLANNSTEDNHPPLSLCNDGQQENTVTNSQTMGSVTRGGKDSTYQKNSSGYPAQGNDMRLERRRMQEGQWIPED